MLLESREGSMCPKLKGAICDMVGISPEKLECVKREDCLSASWTDCEIYISQFFFDRNDEYIGTPFQKGSKAA